MSASCGAAAIGGSADARKQPPLEPQKPGTITTSTNSSTSSCTNAQQEPPATSSSPDHGLTFADLPTTDLALLNPQTIHPRQPPPLPQQPDADDDNNSYYDDNNNNNNNHHHQDNNHDNQNNHKSKNNAPIIIHHQPPPDNHPPTRTPPPPPPPSHHNHQQPQQQHQHQQQQHHHQHHQHHQILFQQQTPPSSKPAADTPSRRDDAHTTRQNSISPARVTARRPSPGLAARLKALGFGSSTKSPQDSPSAAALRAEAIGRLDEEQLRQLDQGHQTGSEVPIVERRGRPWKGALVRIPSKASLKGLKLNPLRKSPSTSSLVDATGPADTAAAMVLEGPQLLPEIDAVPKLDMDADRFHLPELHHNDGGAAESQHQATGQGQPQSQPVRAVTPTTPADVGQDDDDADDDDKSARPLPPPKDSPPLSSATGSATTPATDFSQDIHFNPLGLQRPGSIYTLSRASFANQLAQLTSLQLPDAESLSGKVAAIPTAQSAARALIGAAEQIRIWISKASEVISGLDSEDDVEWSAAGGREGLEEVESAIGRFKGLIKVYLSAIEALNNRPDIGSVAPEDLSRTVTQMDAITKEWANIHVTLNAVKRQVEIAMEWEELWDMVLGDIQNEMDELCRLVFEMEERRHKSMLDLTNSQDGSSSIDISDLETIVEETLPANARLLAAKTQRFGLPAFPPSPSSPGISTLTKDDSCLLALFARMQPLRASLDFLPMRLSVFAARAESTFPSACEELQMRSEDLNASYKKLEKDAKSLREELGEDQWIATFRGAARQAQKMYESVERSLSKLKEAMDGGLHLTNPALMGKKIETYEGKKTHYGSAIERVLSIIDRGLNERYTVNGEIVRLHAELQAKWEDLKDNLREMDLALDEVAGVGGKGKTLRDSVSTMLSNDLSGIGSGRETPQSSPPSSVIMSTLGLETPKSRLMTKRRSPSGNQTGLPKPATRRSLSSVGAGSTDKQQQQPRNPVTRLSTTGGLIREGSITPMAKKSQGVGVVRAPVNNNNNVPNRPRWNMSTNGIDTGHNFKPLAVEPQHTPSPRSSATKVPFRSPLSGRAGSASPMPDSTPSKPPSSHNRYSFRERLASPGPYSQQAIAASRVNQPRLTTQSSMSALTNRRSSLQPPGRTDVDAPLGTNPVRPASSLATTNSRRTSLLPQGAAGGLRALKDRGSSISGRTTPATPRATFRKSQSEKPVDNKPRWKF